MKTISRHPLSTALLSGALAFGLAGAAFAEKPQAQSDQRNSYSQSSMQQSNKQQGSLTQADQQFIDKVLQANAAAVAMGKLAQDKGGQRVQQYGQTLVDDHKKALSKLASISPGADRMQTKVDAEHQRMLDQLSTLSGDKFDQKFASMMEQAHRKDIDLFQKAANGQQYSQQIQQYAQNTLPTLQQHLQTAQRIDQQTSVASKERD